MKKIINVIVEKTKDNRYEVICIDPDWLLVKEKRKNITDALVYLWCRIVWGQTKWRTGEGHNKVFLHIVNAEEFTKEIEEAQENKYMAMSKVIDN